jgi:lysosomal Pro-X carboxypeptidase
MLASWWRILYPHLVDGAIAGSAPVLDFEPLVDDEGIESFSYIVTRDASPEGGSNEFCAENVRAAWPVISRMAKSAGGRQELMERFRICPGEGVMATEEDVGGLLEWLQSKWMGCVEGRVQEKAGQRLPCRFQVLSFGMYSSLQSQIPSATHVYYFFLNSFLKHKK